MVFEFGFNGKEKQIIDLFAATFGASEGAEEGAAIGGLVQDLMRKTPAEDITCFTVGEDNALLGAILFTRLRYAGDAREVQLLAPVAVTTARQGEGIGQALLRHALNAMRASGTEIAVTYGDPAYYGRVGFDVVAETDLPAPLPLQYPHGWQAQSLTDRPIGALTGPASCVEAFNDPSFW